MEERTDSSTTLQVRTFVFNDSTCWLQICLLIFNLLPDMRWFGNAIPLMALGKKTVKQPVYVKTFTFLVAFGIVLYSVIMHSFSFRWPMWERPLLTQPETLMQMGRRSRLLGMFAVSSPIK